jgi:hypothetical protein
LNLAHVRKGECPLCQETRGLYQDLSREAKGELRCRFCWKSRPQQLAMWKLPSLGTRKLQIIDEGGPFTEADATMFRAAMERSHCELSDSSFLLPRLPEQWPILGTVANEDEEIPQPGARSQDSVDADEYAIRVALEVVDQAHYAGGVDYSVGPDDIAVTVFETDDCGGQVILDTLAGEAARTVLDQATAAAGEESAPIVLRDGRHRCTLLGGGGIGIAAMMMLSMRNRRY